MWQEPFHGALTGWLELADKVGSSYKDPISSSCTVCAIGGVVRRKLPRNFSLNQAIEVARRATKGRYSFDHTYRSELKSKNYLSALSIFFEQNVGEVFHPSFRPKLVAFVARHFPEYVYLTIPKV